MNLREWTAAAVESGGQDPPDPDEWVAVEGPERPARFADERAVAYRTQFTDPGDARSQLRLDGLYAHARIWLDGDLLGEHDAYFEPFRAVVDSAGEHELVVVCRAPDDRFGGVFETDHVSPRERVPGIRWGATVEPIPEVALTDLTIRPDDGDETGINVIVTVDAAVDFSGRVRLSLHPDGSDATSGMTQVGVSADAGERVTVQGRLSVRDPNRWWPRGFGSPHRYTVRASLANHERTATTGFRTVAYDSSGLSVNGTRIPVRGRVVLPTADPDDAVTAVERAAETNATLVRWYGHAPPEAAYAAADEAGVLLMQDLPMSPGALDVERARSVARRLSGAYGHHASLALFGVHDDAHAFETTTDQGSWRVCRGVGGRERAATATTAASALSGGVPALAIPGLDAGAEGDENGWVVDGYAGATGDLDAGTHTRYVVPGTDDTAARNAERTVAALRRTGTPFVTAFAPPDATSVEPTITTGFEPVTVFLDDPTGSEPTVIVLNDTADSIEGEVEWSAGDRDGTLAVDLGPVSRSTIGTVDPPADADAIEIALSTEGRQLETSYPR